MSKKLPELDERDHAIIRCVLHDPGILLKEISGAIASPVGGLTIGLPPSTAQKRLRALIEEKKVLRRVTTVDRIRSGYTLRYRIDITVNSTILREWSRRRNPSEPNHQKELARRIVELAKDDKYKTEIFVADVSILFGPADIAIELWAKDPKTVLAFVAEELRNIEGVQNTATAQMVWSVKEENSDGLKHETVQGV